jgi:hypothetical protein
MGPTSFSNASADGACAAGSALVDAAGVCATMGDIPSIATHAVMTASLAGAGKRSRDRWMFMSMDPVAGWSPEFIN